MDAFSWLGDLMRLIGSLFPRWLHVDQSEIAASWTRGREPVVLSPGLVWYWPFWTRVVIASSQEHSITASAIVGGAKVVCVVVYSLFDSDQGVRNALVKVEDVHAMIPQVVRAVLADYAAVHTMDDRAEANAELEALVRKRLLACGAKVRSVELADHIRGLILIHETRAAGPIHEEEE